MSGTTTTQQAAQAIAAVGEAAQLASSVFETAATTGTTIDKPTLVATIIEALGLGIASTLTGGAASTAAAVAPVGESLIAEMVSLFEQIHKPAATPAPTPAPAAPAPAQGAPASPPSA